MAAMVATWDLHCHETKGPPARARGPARTPRGRELQTLCAWAWRGPLMTPVSPAIRRDMPSCPV